MRKAIAILAVVALLVAATYAVAATARQTSSKPGVRAAPAKKTGYICPVMGGKVKNTKTAPKSVYKGKTYYFCCQACKPKFDKNPGKYVKPVVTKTKPAPAAKPALAAEQTTVLCPVMGGKVANLKNAPKSVYKGKTYYFCCPGCKPMFDKDPEKYIKAAPKS